jgi:uncharacterized membrane-anchored protein
MSLGRSITILAATLAIISSTAAAAVADAGGRPEDQKATNPAGAPEQGGQPNPFEGIEWQQGPLDGKLGALATLKVPEGFTFSDGEGAKKFLTATQNIASGDELGLVLPSSEEASWFLIFDYSNVGHVKDDEKDAIDADALLKTLQENTASSNEIRKQRGYPDIQLTGWAKPPFYDPKTHNLTWATIIESASGHRSVNYSTRLLGRGGYMNVDLVISPEDLDAALPQFDKLIEGFTYVEGSRYAEWRPGEKVAAYGLSALVVGGAGALAVKTGLLAKFWKLIVAAVAAAAAGLKKVFTKATRAGEMTPPSPGPNHSPQA